MFNAYSEIFARRGHAYHQAMVRFPLAQQAEFDEILKLADIKDGGCLCDAPSGGGYLNKYLTSSPSLVDSADQFISHYEENPEINGVCCGLEKLALATESMDTIVSLAGLHHLPDRKLFYLEALLILKPGGTICIADVAEGSNVAGFLNIFVDRHNSMGHRGEFFTEAARDELMSCGFASVLSYRKQYHWHFDSQEDMVLYCRLMFGLDRANDKQTLIGIDKYLGFQELNGK